MQCVMFLAACVTAICIAAPARPAGGDETLGSLRRMLASAGFSVPAAEAATAPAGFRISTAIQDYREPMRDLAVHTLTPLRIGGRSFAKGIGAHANGRIVVDLASPYKRLSAWVGVDDNSDTAGGKGSVECIVKVDGRETAHTKVLRGGDAPVRIDVDLAGVKRLELILTDAGDGYFHDQADWAEALLETAGGQMENVGDALSDAATRLPLETVPTAFDFGGKPCWDLFRAWKRAEAAPVVIPGGTRYSMTWKQPGTGFEATLTAALFENPASVELGWRMANRGAAASEMVTNLASIALAAPAGEGRATLTSCSGGLIGDFQGRPERTGFELSHTPLGERTLTVVGGRSSEGDLPFMILNGAGPWGFAVGLGWSGHWAAVARFDRAASQVSLRMGMEPVHFRLEPGQEITLPAALLIPFRGTEADGANRLRRILRDRFEAKLDGRPVAPPVSFNTWFTFTTGVDEALLRDLATRAAALGIEYFCQDAGWFEGDFPDGVGNWTVNRTKLPGGLKPVADYVHSLGMKFGLWFEPERVAAGTRWAKEHPDLVVGDLLDLGRPEARKLVLDMLDTTITENGVDWIRYDFNTDPMGAWQRMEDADHQGLRQIQYVDGLYWILDELMKRHPDLLIEQCAGGGRRIDLETIKRGHTYWKSDACDGGALMRFQETGANLFLPGGLLNTNYCEFRSAGELAGLFAGPLGFGLDFRKLKPEQAEAIKHVVAAYKRVREFINDDYYPLFAQSPSEQTWNGWQFLDPARQEGFLAVHRQMGSPYSAAQVRPSGLDEAATYKLEEVLTGKTARATGKELAAGWAVVVKEGETQVWKYGK